MTNYEPQGWQVPTTHGAWHQADPRSRHGSLSTQSQAQLQPLNAFGTQLEEIDRAFDNLMVSGKLYNGMPSRPEPVGMMLAAAPPANYGPRAPYRMSVDFNHMPQQLGPEFQGFVDQRLQPSFNGIDNTLQRKPYNGPNSERNPRNHHTGHHLMGHPTSEAAPHPDNVRNSTYAYADGRKRSVNAYQQRGYEQREQGINAVESGSRGPTVSQSPFTSPISLRGPSPRAFDPFSMAPSRAAPVTADPSSLEGKATYPEKAAIGTSTATSGKVTSPQAAQPRTDHDQINASPGSNAASQSFGFLETTQSSSRTSASSPSGSPPRTSKLPPSNVGPAPIGTRPGQATSLYPPLTKRTGTPNHSPLSYAFSSSDALHASMTGMGASVGRTSSQPTRNERSGSTPSILPGTMSSASSKGETPISAWGSSSGVWGKPSGNKSMGTVWG